MFFCHKIHRTRKLLIGRSIYELGRPYIKVGKSFQSSRQRKILYINKNRFNSCPCRDT